MAIEFAKNCRRAYLASSPAVRRQLNQAIFEKPYVFDDGHVILDRGARSTATATRDPAQQASQPPQDTKTPATVHVSRV